MAPRRTPQAEQAAIEKARRERTDEQRRKQAERREIADRPDVRATVRLAEAVEELTKVLRDQVGVATREGRG